MKKVVFTIAGLFMLMLVGCGGDSGSVTTSNAGVVDDAGDAVVKSSGAYIPNGLPDIPAIPE